VQGDKWQAIATNQPSRGNATSPKKTIASATEERRGDAPPTKDSEARRPPPDERANNKQKTKYQHSFPIRPKKKKAAQTAIDIWTMHPYPLLFFFSFLSPFKGERSALKER
jgi:hypothetical protein